MVTLLMEWLSPPGNYEGHPVTKPQADENLKRQEVLLPRMYIDKMAGTEIYALRIALRVHLDRGGEQPDWSATPKGTAAYRKWAGLEL